MYISLLKAARTFTIDSFTVALVTTADRTFADVLAIPMFAAVLFHGVPFVFSPQPRLAFAVRGEPW
jgi:hypothetical protein